jgi:SH3-like domain-containing protein
MSYVNDDDKYANGKITQFREHLSRAVKVHSGKPFEIFQDKKDIKWGQPWQERINDALDATLFLIPIITPLFFNSAACREELERFLKREKDLGRGDLILPVYYFDYPVLNDKEKLKQDPLTEIISTRQREDWRELWHHSFNTRKLNKALEKMARQIMAAMERSEAEASRVKTEKDNSTSASGNAFSNTGDGTQSIAQGSHAIGTQINNYYASPPQDSPSPVLAAKFVSVSKDGVELCYDADVSSKVHFSLPMGYPLEVICRKGEWVNVRDYEQEEGWVAANLVSDTPYVIVKAAKGNIRSGPSTEFDQIGKVVRDVILRKVEEKGDWVKVYHPQVTGWIVKQLIWP